MTAIAAAADHAEQSHRWHSQHLSINDLADRWQIPVSTVRNRRAMGDGPKALKIGGALRFRLEDVIAYEEQQLEREA